MTSRRNFLKNTVKTTISSAVLTPYLFSSAQTAFAQTAPSNRLRMGCIGVGSMGKYDARDFSRLVDIVAVCDVDSRKTQDCLEDDLIGVKQANGDKKQPDVYKDYRDILDRKDIDVVTVITPDHWHVKIAVEALMSGKHLFVQKPLTLTIEENKLIRKAAEKYKTVVQVGTQQRSQRNEFMTAALMIRNGLLGDIQRVTCDIGGSPACDPIPLAQCPETLDFDTWLGQAPKVDYIATAQTTTEYDKYTWPSNSRTHYEFRWWYEYSGGKFTDWGAHHIDCAMWALGFQTPGTGPSLIVPTEVVHPVPYKDGFPTETNRYNTATQFDILCKFDNGVEMRVVSNSRDGNGIRFEGTKGTIHVSRGRIKGRPYTEMLEKDQDTFSEEDYTAINRGKKAVGDHKANFVDCIRNGGTPVSDVASHVQAMHVCHLCGIAGRLGRSIKWDSKNETIVEDAQAASFMSRERRKGFDIVDVG